MLFFYFKFLDKYFESINKVLLIMNLSINISHHINNTL